jgi:hypothetical protein
MTGVFPRLWCANTRSGQCGREVIVTLRKMRLPKAAELDATGLMPYLCAVCDRFCAG